MITNISFGTVFLTLLVSVYGIIAAWMGMRRQRPHLLESARRAMLLTFPLLSLGVLGLIYLMVTEHYELRYVASVIDGNMPTYLRITALWGGQAGSLLFWSWLMAAFASAVALRRWDRDQDLLPGVVIVSLATLAFFLAVVVFVENPFARAWEMANGQLKFAFFQPAGASAVVLRPQGMNPLLRHFGMVFHPPLLYLGFVSFVIPYAFAIAALAVRRKDDRWIQVSRRWILASWLFLSLGLILGARWAYDVLGWGGYWGWDPVEVAALLPWLTATPLLHSIGLQQKRGMFKRWNIFLIILTYSLVIFGTMVTRSGILNSVHAFGQSAVGPLLFGFTFVTLIASLWLMTRRGETLVSENTLTSAFSREAFVLLNNFLFFGLFMICFWGVFYPIFTDTLGTFFQAVPALAGINIQKVTVGVDYYEKTTPVFWGAILFLMGLCPLAAWGYATIKTLGRSTWKLLAATLLFSAVFWALGVRQWGGLLGFALLVLATLTIGHEFWYGVRARRRSGGEDVLTALGRLFVRNRRRYGAQLVHLSVVFMALGVIGIEMFQTQTQATIPLKGEIRLGRFTLRFDDLNSRRPNMLREETVATLSVFKDGHLVGQVKPRRDDYLLQEQSVTMPGVRSTLEDDLYVSLVDWKELTNDSATFKVFRNPLVLWLWLGSILLVIGTLVAAWPEAEAAAIRNAAGQNPGRQA